MLRGARPGWGLRLFMTNTGVRLAQKGEPVNPGLNDKSSLRRYFVYHWKQKKGFDFYYSDLIDILVNGLFGRFIA